MRVGDLVRFVGVASYYKGTVGVVTKLYQCGAGHQHQDNPDSAVVYIANKSEGRKWRGGPRLHPLAFEELEVINEGR
jgi:hypothetical protein